MPSNINHIMDTVSILTTASAREKLKNHPIEVALYTNVEYKYSIVHSHPYYEIILPLAGQVHYSSGGNVYDLYAGDMILIPAEVYHTFYADNMETPYERIITQIDADYWNALCKDLHVEDTLGRGDILLLRSKAISRWNLRGLFERMHKSTELTDFHRDIAFRSQLSEFMMIIDQAVAECLSATPDSTSTLATKALEYLEAHFKEPELCTNDLVEHTFVSREHLSRVFKEYTGQSIHVYITALRMQAFRDALAEGQSILTACTEAGFSDYSSFNRSFKKLYGMTPREYRDRLKSSENGSRLASSFVSI